MDPSERFARALDGVESALDWTALGRSYCSVGGDDFFADEDRAALFDAALRLASDVAQELEGRDGGPGHSLYVGAAVAEVVPVLVETLVLGRRVTLHSLDGVETRLLNRALERAEEAAGATLPRIRTDPLPEEPPGSFDHLWFVSVVNDPDAFPALHDELYERAGTDAATGRGDAAAEREVARRLARTALAGLTAQALLTTTREELPIWEEVCRASGRTLRPSDRARLSPVVGDPVVLCRLG